MNSQVISITYTRRTRVWVFPKNRFVQYGPSDERWCRFFGIGREEEVVETVTIPRAIVESVTENGVTFRGLADAVEEWQWRTVP